MPSLTRDISKDKTKPFSSIKTAPSPPKAYKAPSSVKRKSPSPAPPGTSKTTRRPGKDLTSEEKTHFIAKVNKHHPQTNGASVPSGKKPYESAAELYRSSNLPPSKDQGFCTGACFDNAAFFLVRDGWLSKEEQDILSQVDPHYKAMVKAVPILNSIDFSSLKQPRLDYASQKEIDPERVIQLSACAVHYGLDFGRVIRYLGNEYTASYRDLDQLRKEVKPHISSDDFGQITRILTKGCPAELQFELPREHKNRMLRRGNQKSVLDHKPEVWSTMNKEEKHCHIIPFFSWVCRFANSAHHVPQGMVMKPGKDPRIVWDGSTKLLPDDIVMNDVVPVECEAPITFGRSKECYLKHIYNTRLSHPSEEIALANADVKAAHRYPRIQPCLAGAFGFLIHGLYYFVTTAMVFGSIVSATSWEPFRRAIEQMTEALSLRTDLAAKHKSFLDMITIADPPDQDTTFVAAVPCEINKGVLDEDGNQRPIPNFIYVDDCLLACAYRYVRNYLAACIEAIFAVLGRPDTSRRQCPLALDKWIGMTVSHRIVSIGLIFDSRRLTVGITKEYTDEVLDIINEQWPKGKKYFALDSIVVLAGKLARLGEGAPWVFHLMTHIYASIAYALRHNEQFLLRENSSFKQLIRKIKDLRLLPKVTQDVEHINFYLQKSAKMKFKSNSRYPVNRTLSEEIELLRQWLNPSSGISWESPIGHSIPRTPSAVSVGDSCLFGGGGFCIGLRFWWHLVWPNKVYRRTKAFITDNSNGKLISINVLEFVTIVINYAAALTALQEDNLINDPSPVLLNFADNTSSVRWTNHCCKKSLPGRALGRLLCNLLVNSPLGVNAKWIRGVENEIADEISRIKSSHENLFFNYSHLKQKFPILASCRAFQPSRDLLSLIWQCVLESKSPTPEQIQTLKRNGLGKLTT